METLVCKFEYFIVSGAAYIEDLFGKLKSVEMIPMVVKDKKEIYSCINSGEYKANKILYAFLEIKKHYSNNIDIFDREEYYNCLNPGKSIPKKVKDSLDSYDDDYIFES